MNQQSIARYAFTIIAGLLVWLIIYLVRRKLDNPDFGLAWGGIAFIGFFALLFIFFSGASWVGLYLKSETIDIDATFDAVKSDTIIVTEDGSRIYKWKLQCYWNDPKTGRRVNFTSDIFEGTELFYNRSKIKVSVYPDKPETFYTVDLTYLTSTQQPGITLVNKDLIGEADRNYRVKIEKRQTYESDQQRRREESRGLSVLLNRLVAAVTLLLVLLGLILGARIYWQNRTSKNKIRDFENTTKEIMQRKGWNFSFEPNELPPKSLLNFLQRPPDTPYPFGFAYVTGIIDNDSWKLTVTINPTSAKRYNQSHQEHLLRNSDYSHLVIPLQSFSDNAFFALMDIPAFFPEDLKSKLSQTQITEETKFLTNIPSDTHKTIFGLYMQQLFEKLNGRIYRTKQTHRSGDFYSNRQWVTITSDADLIAFFTNSSLKDQLIRIGQSEKGGYGISVSSDGIMISTMQTVLNPDEIQAMVDLGRMIKTNIKKLEIPPSK